MAGLRLGQSAVMQAENGLERDALMLAIDKMNNLPNALRQAMADDLWASIPTFVDEYIYAANLPAGSPLPCPPQTGTLELITSVVVSIPSGATGLVTLGGMSLPVGPGVTVIAPVQKLLGSSDTRSVTTAGAPGPTSLWLTGRQLPTFGSLQK